MKIRLSGIDKKKELKIRLDKGKGYLEKNVVELVCFWCLEVVGAKDLAVKRGVCGTNHNTILPSP